MTYPDGSFYEGDFSYDEKHGEGTQTWADGTTYSGSWKDDEISG